MKTLVTAIMLILTTSVLAQTPYTVSKDHKNGSLVFKGKITFKDLNGEPSFRWMREGYEHYQPKSKWTSELKTNLANTTMVVFMGTWCSDSQDLIPKLEKVLDEIGYPQAQVTVYGVDRDKTTADGASEQYQITNVPTIIVLKGGKEIGRITESTHRSIEADLTKIARP